MYYRHNNYHLNYFVSIAKSSVPVGRDMTTKEICALVGIIHLTAGTYMYVIVSVFQYACPSEV